MAAVTADTMVLPKIGETKWISGKRHRSVKSVTSAPTGYEGEGFPVRRAFAGVSKEDLDPFVHMDQMGEVEYSPGEPKGTPWHPHRGFETFTYLMDGVFLHQDSHGGGGVIKDGGTQYMTAGSGILHIETPPEELVMSGGLFHGIQLWINLPKSKKSIAPAYQNLEGEDVILLASPDGGALIRLIAGKLDEQEGPGRSQTPMSILHATVSPGAQLELPWDEKFNALAYVLAGNGYVGTEKYPINTGQLIVFNNSVAGENAIVFEANHLQESRSPNLELLVLGGEPIREPVYQYGPFVMNTKAEVMQAVEDYQAGRLGVIPPDAIMPHTG
jgi:redox-sensitive bicupin YhaK (pirin superfamily)